MGGYDFSALAQVVIGGIGNGAVYGLVGLGFSLIYRSTGAVNFAQGEWVMLAGLATASGFVAHWPLGVAAAAAFGLVVCVGALTYQIGVRQLPKSTPLLITMVSIGIAIFTKGAVMVTLGKNPNGYPGVFGDALVRFGDVTVPAQTLVVIAVCVFFVLALQFLFARTRLGLALRASAADPETAALVGVPVRTMIMVSFALAAAAGAIAGIVIAPLTLISYDQGTMLGFKGFSAAMLGGMGHPLGAVAGGVLLGVLEALASFQISSRFKDAVAFILLLAVLFVRPTGLFGRKSGERL